MRMKSVAVGACLLLLATSANAAIVDLTITASWVSSNFDVSSTGVDGGSGLPDESDDAVFGIAPSDGSTTFTLRVDTSSAVHFATGYNDGNGPLTHDWYGYSDIVLVGSHTLGDAIWTTSDILQTLVGPDGLTRGLWTDADIASTSPSVLSFRMIGETASGLSADIFLGSRSSTTISDAVLIWEYFGGEEIRNTNPDISIGSGTTAISTGPSTVSEPMTAMLLIMGSVVLVRRRRRLG